MHRGRWPALTLLQQGTLVTAGYNVIVKILFQYPLADGDNGQHQYMANPGIIYSIT
jgi:hypothetical protein